MNSRFNGATIVVTGASGGVGRATARAFGACGARVGLIARGLEGLQDAVREVEAAGGRGLAAPADVAEPEAVERAAEAIELAFGPIDVWVNCAMTTVYGTLDRMSPGEFQRVMDVSFMGYVHGTMSALRRMRPRRFGTIVQVGSSLAYRGIPLQSAYCAAKFAIRGFTESIRCELLHEQSPVAMTMVQLCAVNTPQFDWARNKMNGRPRPAGPVVQPEVAAAAILHAATTGQRELWLDWSTLPLIMGNMAIPGTLDRVVARRAGDAQISDRPDPPGRPDNLFAPVPSVRGAHGRFDGKAAPSASFINPAILRGGLAAIGGLGLAGLAIGLARRQRGS